MTKKHKIIYWVATIWLSLGMVSTGIAQLINLAEVIEETSVKLGYPIYFLTIIGIWKILGVITLLIPKFPLIKEWAYAGFFFLMSGAIVSHLAVNDSLSELFGPCLLIVLIITSWYFRPDSKKLIK